MKKTPADLLSSLASKPSRLICGIMSGTSLDGIDIAFVQVRDHGESTQIKLEAFEEIPFEDEVQEMIRRNSEPDSSSVNEICFLHTLLGYVYADAVKSTAMKHNIDVSSVDLIGLHGQTIHHLPKPRHYSRYSIGSTLQIGNGSTLAALLNLPVISDFRSADVTLGGQGAPLVPYFDYIMFRSDDTDRAMINIGGIANITVLKKGCSLNEVIAFDTGPGNMVIDGLMRHYYNKDYDMNGSIASQGHVHNEMLLSLLQHSYIEQPFPKSTGREMFGDNYLHTIIRVAEEKYHLTPEDIIATLTQFTIACIAHAIRKYVREDSSLEIIVSGGGAQNKQMMQCLKDTLSSASITPIDTFGIPSNAKEAICFSVLANEWLYGNAVNIPSVTGAQRAVISGSFAMC